MRRNLNRDADTGRRKSPSKEQDRISRENLEALSESVSLLRNHFYNYAFENETLLKVADARKIR